MSCPNYGCKNANCVGENCILERPLRDFGKITAILSPENYDDIIAKLGCNPDYNTFPDIEVNDIRFIRGYDGKPAERLIAQQFVFTEEESDIAELAERVEKLEKSNIEAIVDQLRWRVDNLVDSNNKTLSHMRKQDGIVIHPLAFDFMVQGWIANGREPLGIVSPGVSKTELTIDGIKFIRGKK
jgi:hypothetical protein